MALNLIFKYAGIKAHNNPPIDPITIIKGNTKKLSNGYNAKPVDKAQKEAVCAMNTPHGNGLHNAPGWRMTLYRVLCMAQRAFASAVLQEITTCSTV